MITYDDELLHKAILYNGGETQVLVAVEELSELQKELLKNVNRGEDNLDHIKEELVDVLIMVRQLVFIYGFGLSELNKIASEKQARLKGRLNGKLENKTGSFTGRS